MTTNLPSTVSAHPLANNANPDPQPQLANIHQLHGQQTGLLHQVNELHAKQQHWLQRLQLSGAERVLVETYLTRQQEALNDALQHRNASWRAVGEAQVLFVREATRSLLLTARTDMQYNRSTLYQQRALELHQALEAKNRDFWQLVEDKMTDAHDRPAAIQALIHQQVERMLAQWTASVDEILDGFHELLLAARQPEQPTLPRST